MKCKTCKQEIKEVIGKTIIIDGKEYETTTHDFNKKLSEIQILKGWQLWTYEDCIKLHNNLKYRKSLNLENCWFFIEPPYNFNKSFVARFYASSSGADLVCSRDPDVSGSVLGVRFFRDVRDEK